jgi:hypothetical protein
MDIIDLPLLHAVDPPKRAWDVMRERKRAAVVVVSAKPTAPMSLIRAAAVLDAINRGINQLGDVKQKHELVQPTSQELAAQGLDVARPFKTRAQFESMLDAAGNRLYGLLAAGSDVSLVFTRYEKKGEPLSSGPDDCYCTACEESAGGPPPAGKCRICKRTNTITCTTY